MEFTELAGIKLPRRLFDAAKNGELVVFAGAGVSMQGESPLPDFGNLVSRISQIVDAAHKLRPFDREKDTCEKYLGELETLYGGIVRMECAKALSSGAYAEIHRNIISLFDSNPPRVVTTNFDTRFEQAADVLGVQLRVFSGPALPVGDSFMGLVHLHGSLDYPDEMVLSDSDFGKAYVSDGWASRFLVKMFSRFTVLFVGYSFSDTLVQYLARSISADVKGRVFALEREEDKLDGWLRRGITPVQFDSFDQLPDLFYEWHRRDAITVYECSKTVEHIADISLKASSEEKGELVRLLTESSTEEQAAYAEVYTRGSRDFSSVELLIELGLDDFLFQERLSGRDSVFSTWIARSHAMTDYVQLIGLAMGKGKSLSRDLCFRILFELGQVQPDDKCLSAWASYMEPAMIGSNGFAVYGLYQIIEGCREPRLAFSWIRKLFAISPVCRDSFSDRMLQSLEPAFAFEGDGFPRELPEVILKYADSLGWDSFLFLVNQLEEAREIETEHGLNANAFDSWSFDRSAIEEHEQDEHSRGLLAALIAVLRDVGTALISGCTSGISVIERCLCSHAHLVKRMGLYWLPLTGASPNQIIEFIISHGCLRDSYLIHETFMLLSTSYPSADSEVKTLFMEEVRGSYPNVSDVNDAYERFNVLKWLERHGAEDDYISAELAAIHESFPYFEVREYPDLGHYMTLGLESEDERFRVEEDVFSPEKLRELCIAAEKSHSMLRRWDIVSAPMRQYPEEGLNVAGQLLSSAEDDYREMAKVALSSIRWEDLGDDSLCEASEVIVAGLQHDDTYSSAVRALDAFVGSLRESLLEKVSLWQPALDLAFENVEWLSAEDYAIAESDKRDWLTVSINHASGALIETVAKVIAASSTVDDNEARELGRRYIGKLVSRLDSHDDCSRCLAASLLSEINIWVFVDVDLMRAALSRILEPGGPLLVPATWGLSYVSRLSENSWNVLKSWFMQSLGETSLAEAPQSKLASLFVWAAIVYGSYDDRRQVVTISSAMSLEACSAVSFRLLDWVGQLKDDARNIEWETWLGDAISSMFVPDENFKAAGHYLVRWLKKCGCLAPEIGRLLISWRKRKCDGIFLERGSLRELVARGAVTDVDKALLLVFFLSNGPIYQSITEFEEVAKGLDPDAIDRDTLAELRDAFILRFASVPDCLK